MPFVEIIQKYSTGILPEVSRPTTKPFVVGRQMIFYRTATLYVLGDKTGETKNVPFNLPAKEI